MKIIFVTGNQGKYEEAKLIIPEIEKLDIDLDEIQSLDPKKVIEHKLQEARINIDDGIVLVEDNSFIIDGTNGLPGCLIKWFMKSVGNDGLVKIAGEFGNKSVEASVIIGAIFADKTIKYYEGAISGKIVEPRGENGFGWDAIFLPDGFEKTFGEMTVEEKNMVSMRKIALEKLKADLTS